MNKGIFYLFLTGSLLGLFGFALYYQEQPSKPQSGIWASDTEERFTTRLGSIKMFRQFQGEPLSGRFNQVQSIKVVWDIRSNHIFFINSKFFLYHYNFCTQELGYAESLDVFNSYNYTESTEQRYFLANLNYYSAIDKYALEFTSGTDYEAGSLKRFCKMVSENSFIRENQLHVLVGSGYLMNLADNKQLQTPLLYPDEIYQNQQYQLLQSGVAYGYLRAHKDLDKTFEQVSNRDILLIQGTPVRIPPCAAMLTESFQTPLSHIQILARNRNIPAAVVKNLWSDKYPADCINKPVKLTLTANEWQIELCSAQAVDSFFSQQPNTQQVVLSCDSSEQTLISGKKLRIYSAGAVGTKAAALGELQHLSKKSGYKWKTPEGLFAIPFFFYMQHMKHAEIQAALQQVLIATDAQLRKKALKHLRQAIKMAPLDKSLLKTVEAMILQNNCGTEYRFRSSSNAEDLQGFSGAGLYTSKTGKLNNPEKSVEKAILDVWASAWSEAAYNERSYKHIDQKSVAMGIACHRNFPAEAANGVAITQNIYRPGFVGFTINVQLGESSVVNPEPGLRCEQFILIDQSLINPLARGIGADYISGSSLCPGKRVLNEEQLKLLYQALDAVKEHFYAKTEWGVGMADDFALDIEFKFESNGTLYLKQVRMYPGH